MKIIGEMSGSTYMVSMTEQEIRRAGGFPDYESLSNNIYYYKEAYQRGGAFRIGAVIEFVEPTTKLRRLCEQEAKVRQSAAMLRGLADMMEALEPSKIIAPDTSDSSGTTQGSS